MSVSVSAVPQDLNILASSINANLNNNACSDIFASPEPLGFGNVTFKLYQITDFHCTPLT